jgi:hypothetical protein
VAGGLLMGDGLGRCLLLGDGVVLKTGCCFLGKGRTMSEGGELD